MNRTPVDRGRFITLEGSEGVGKSSHLGLVSDVIAQAGFKVITTREPGGTGRAERIRELLLVASAEPMPQMCELLLMFAARSTHLDNVVRPALERGTWIVCDRFTDATYAYQGGARGMPVEHIAALERMVQGALRPDFTLLLDAPVEQALERVRVRARPETGGADRFEQERAAFFERVRATYLARAQAEPERIQVIDASQSLAAVAAAVRSALERYMTTLAPPDAPHG